MNRTCCLTLTALLSFTGLSFDARAQDSHDQEAAGAAEKENRFVASLGALIDKNRKDDAEVRVRDAEGRPVPGAVVAVEQTRHSFLFGYANLDPEGIRERSGATAEEVAIYKQRFLEMFNYATLPFYWRRFEPEPGKPMYEHMDRLVAWCMERNIRMKGHNLLWHNKLSKPVWLEGEPSEALKKKRVMETVKHYAGKVAAWEVVCEAGAAREAAEPYRWARQADPNAYLVIDHFGMYPDGRPSVYRIFEQLIADNVPIDGLGLQGHQPRTERYNVSIWWDVLDRYAELGKDLHITDFAPRSAGRMTGWLEGDWDEAGQADYAVKFYKTCFAHPAVVAITWGNMTDKYSWQPHGGLLREDMTPKPVYGALKNLIHKEWKTSAQGKTDADGVFRFRGFRGTYNVTTTEAGTTNEQTEHLRKAEPNVWTVNVEAPQKALQ